MEQKEQETKFFDFTQVEMEVSFELDELARTIYKEGKADIPVMYIPAIVEILKMPHSLMAAGGKVAVINMLNQ